MSSEAHLLPDNATPQEKAVSSSVSRAGNVSNPVGQLWSPYECPAEVLPWLAWALSVDDWEESWTEQQKRDAVAASVEVHRRKGTIGALKRALQAIGYEVAIDEDTGQAYTFRLRVDASEIGIEGPEIYDGVERIALSNKNARSHLLGVDGFLRGESPCLVAAATISGENSEIMPAVIASRESSGFVYTGVAEHTIDTTIAFPTIPRTAVGRSDNYLATLAFPEITVTLADPSKQILQRMTVESLSYVDDDLRITVGNQVVSDTQWNVSWYYEDTYGGPGFHAHPAYMTEGFRKVVIEPTPATQNLYAIGAVVKVDAFDGWRGGWRTAPWRATLEFADGHTKVIEGGSVQSGTSPDIGPESSTPDYHATGPHLWNYIPNGNFTIER